MPERDQDEALTIPPEFGDYTRRLITWSTSTDKHQFNAFIDSAIKDELEKFAPAEQRVSFSVGSLHVRVLFLRNENFSIQEAAQDFNDSLKYPGCIAEADTRIVPAALAPNDPLYPQQWALRKIEAPAAWQRLADVAAANPRPAITVAIIDSGIQKDHEDLDPSAISGASVINSNPAIFADRDGHGTMLAGTIAAITGNGRGIAGEVPKDAKVSLFACQFNDVTTPGTASAATLAIAISLAAGAKIINASWHVLGDSGALRQAIIQAGTMGCVFVAAAGNYGSNNSEYPTLPASYGLANMVVTMASDDHDVKSWFSNYGHTVDVAAPGERILTTGLYFVRPAYRSFDGTSAAAAHVSGAAAMLLAIDDWTPAEIRHHLVASAVQRRGLRGTCRAEGRLDLKRAVLGPFAITKPAGGDMIPRGSSCLVEWDTEYVAPVVSSVAVSVIDKPTRTVLRTFGGLSDNGSTLITLPNFPVAQALVRVRCEQKNLYDESGVFQIT